MLRLAALALASTTTALGAAPVACDNGLVTVTGGTPEIAARVCAASDGALGLFGQCGQILAEPVEVRLIPETDSGCFGLFHCGESRIDLLVPEAMAEKRRADSIFAHIPIERFFDSIVVHEMSHALYDQVPCPQTYCMATSEYLAYSYQIASLSDADRAPFEDIVADAETVPRDMINSFILMMAPDRFASAAWTHLNQRDDQCAWIEGIFSQVILFDHEAP